MLIDTDIYGLLTFHYLLLPVDAVRYRHIWTVAHALRKEGVTYTIAICILNKLHQQIIEVV